jgi:hypothetical protein
MPIQPDSVAVALRDALARAQYRKIGAIKGKCGACLAHEGFETGVRDFSLQPMKQLGYLSSREGSIAVSEPR